MNRIKHEHWKIPKYRLNVVQLFRLLTKSDRVKTDGYGQMTYSIIMMYSCWAFNCDCFPIRVLKKLFLFIAFLSSTIFSIAHISF